MGRDLAPGGEVERLEIESDNEYLRMNGQSLNLQRFLIGKRMWVMKVNLLSDEAREREKKD